MYVGTEDSKWQAHIVDKYKEYFALTSSFLKYAENLQDEFVKRKIDREELGAEGIVLSFLFAKSYKTTKAALLLCKSGYPEDALILGRASFEFLKTGRVLRKRHKRLSDMMRLIVKEHCINYWTPMKIEMSLGQNFKKR